MEREASAAASPASGIRLLEGSTVPLFYKPRCLLYKGHLLKASVIHPTTDYWHAQGGNKIRQITVAQGSFTHVLSIKVLGRSASPLVE